MHGTCINHRYLQKLQKYITLLGGATMSEGAGGSKKNKENDANHVSAHTKAYQKRMSKINNEEHNDSRKYNGKI
jgi:hypothetical protein